MKFFQQRRISGVRKPIANIKNYLNVFAHKLAGDGLQAMIIWEFVLTCQGATFLDEVERLADIGLYQALDLLRRVRAVKTPRSNENSHLESVAKLRAAAHSEDARLSIQKIFKVSRAFLVEFPTSDVVCFIVNALFVTRPFLCMPINLSVHYAESSRSSTSVM
jgi:hypothetical protein